MKNITAIVASAIMAKANVELLAEALEAQPRLADFLCGDIVPPAENEIKHLCEKDCMKRNRRFVKIISVYLENDFTYRAKYTYAKVLYGKTAADSRYSCHDQENDVYNIPLTFYDHDSISL